MNRFEAARREFRCFRDAVYLNWAGTGPLPTVAADAVKQLLDQLSEWKGPYKDNGLQIITESARSEMAKLLNADASEIGFTGTNTSQAVQTAFDAVSPVKGESIVTCDMQYVLTEAEMQKWRERGVEIRVVKNRNGSYSPEDFAEAIDTDTRAVLLDSVTWVNGYKFNIPEIARIAHENGAYMITDSIQHIGEAVLDAENFGADIIAGGGQKWLSDWLGTGFAYVSARVSEDLARPFYGYRGAVEPPRGWKEFFADPERESFGEFQFYEDARKFQNGGSLHNMAGLTALRETAGLINGIGISEVEKRIISLRNMLVDGLKSMGARINGPEEDTNCSGIVNFTFDAGVEKEKQMVEKLARDGFYTSYRAGGGIYGIRASIHYVNNESDIENFLERLQSYSWIGRGQPL